ncbi:FecR family protein [Roseomonas sp. 18066]|uniref:FecR family protein n=1 Tax=Roseomonas sp. 18066 TaxID=2681412 RepID=UPI00135B369A|nr:FecR domain-containing protein [Roseomonas sp. 18066]
MSAEAALTRIEEQAAIWFTRSRQPGWPAAERQALAAWLAEDPRHAVALREAALLWGALDGQRAAMAAGLPQGLQRSRRGLWRPALGLAGAAAAAGGAFWWSDPAWRADYRSGTGERRVVELAPDGSRAELDAASALSADLSGPSRRLVLHAGQALLTLPPARPFEVIAGDGRLTGTGASLGLHRRADRVSVALLEGSAELLQGGRRLLLERGQAAQYGPAGLQGPGPADPGTATAWRQDQLIFRRAPLGEVVQDLERYRGGVILITDRKTAEISVSGAFSTRNPDAVLNAIGQTLPVRIRQIAHYLVVISAG